MRIRFMAGAACLCVLTACGGQTTPAGEASEAPAPPVSSTAVAPSSAAAPAKGAKPTRDFVVGKWGTNGDCALAIDLRADGTSDGPFGNWAYNDGVISFLDEPEFKVSVTVIDPDTMESTNDSSGKTSRMTRCP